MLSVLSSAVDGNDDDGGGGGGDGDYPGGEATTFIEVESWSDDSPFIGISTVTGEIQPAFKSALSFIVTGLP